MHLILHLSSEQYRMLSSHRFTAAEPSGHDGAALQVACSFGKIGGPFNKEPDYPATVAHVAWADVALIIEQFAAAGHPDAAKMFALISDEPPKASPFKAE